MNIVETDAMRVIGIARRITIPDVRHAAAELTPRIEAEIVRARLKPAGPWIFIAQDLPKDARTVFDWRICRPVECGENYRGVLDLIDLEPIMVALPLHRAPMRSLFTQGYAPLAEKDEQASPGKAARSITAGQAQVPATTRSRSSSALPTRACSGKARRGFRPNGKRSDEKSRASVERAALWFPTLRRSARAYQSMTTFPELPERMASKPSRNSSMPMRWVMTGDRSSPPWTKAIILYQVSNISRP